MTEHQIVPSSSLLIENYESNCSHLTIPLQLSFSDISYSEKYFLWLTHYS
jgi:hypothetical protein